MPIARPFHMVLNRTGANPFRPGLPGASPLRRPKEAKPPRRRSSVPRSTYREFEPIYGPHSNEVVGVRLCPPRVGIG